MGHPDVAYPRCAGVTSDSRSCRALALSNSTFCRVHDPAMIQEHANQVIRQQVRSSAALRRQYRGKLQAAQSHVEATRVAWAQARRQYGAGSDPAVAAHETWIRATVALEQLRAQLDLLA